MATTSHTSNGCVDQNDVLARAGRALRFLLRHPDRELTVEEALRLITLLTKAGFQGHSFLKAGPWDVAFRLVLLTNDGWVTTTCYLYRKGVGIYDARVTTYIQDDQPAALS